MRVDAIFRRSFTVEVVAESVEEAVQLVEKGQGKVVDGDVDTTDADDYDVRLLTDMQTGRIVEM